MCTLVLLSNHQKMTALTPSRFDKDYLLCAAVTSLTAEMCEFFSQ